MKKIVVELEGGWVLKHRDDEELPISKLKSQLQGDKVSIEDSSLTSITILVKGEETDASRVADHIRTAFSKN